MIIWTLKTKFLFPSLYKGEELPLFGYLFPAVQAGKRGDLPARRQGEIF